MTETQEAKHAVLNVPNISCGHCVKAITRELRRLPAVVAVGASAEQKQVTVEFMGDALAEIEKVLSEIGYPVVK